MDKASDMAGEPVKLFISYSHKDEALWNELATHLAILKQQGVLSLWYERQIGAGTEWANQIDDNLRKADIILLLISSDFLASKYCYDIELKQAMKRHEAEEALVVPIIMRPVDWSGAPFGQLQAFPKDALAITTWGEREAAYVNVTRGIREAAFRLLEQRQQKLEQKKAAREQYLKKVEEALSDGKISLAERDTLDELGEELKLTREEAEEIESRAFEPWKKYEQNLKKYEKTVRKYIQHEYPFSDETKKDLKLRQRDLGIKTSDVAQIEQPILAEAQAKYHEKVKKEEALRKQQQERLKQLELQKQREQEEYQKKLRRYEQEFLKTVQGSYPLAQYVRNGLKTFQHSLGLSDEDVERIEKPFFDQKEAEYQKQLAEKQRQKQEAERLRRQQEQIEYQQRLEAERDDLSSERGVDYTRLRDLLKAGEWKDADRETAAVMLKVAGREKEGGLDFQSIEKFPCTDLRTIDTLWRKYSNGRFGFSVQKRLWQSVGGQPGEYDHEIFKKFGERVGWLKVEKMLGLMRVEWWRRYNSLTFTKNEPQGHLPSCIWGGIGLGGINDGKEFWYGAIVSSLAQRLVTCKI